MKTPTHTTLALACAAIVLSACAATESSLRAKGAAPLAGAELTQAYGSGKPLSARATSGGMSTATFNPDGTATVDWGSGNDTGRWHTDGDRMCVTWTKVRGGEQTCFRTYRTGAGEYAMFRLDGSPHATFSDR